MPFFTEKARPCPWPAPWYGSWPRITTRTSWGATLLSAAKISSRGGYTRFRAASSARKPSRARKYGLRVSAPTAASHAAGIGGRNDDDAVAAPVAAPGPAEGGAEDDDADEDAADDEDAAGMSEAALAASFARACWRLCSMRAELGDASPVAAVVVFAAAAASAVADLAFFTGWKNDAMLRFDIALSAQCRRRWSWGSELEPGCRAGTDRSIFGLRIKIIHKPIKFVYPFQKREMGV